MSYKGQTTTLEERVTIAERVDAGQSSREIAEELGRPLPTIRKWRQRYLREGRAGLTSRMGRPAVGALVTAPAEMKDAILELREAHPGWGAQTLRLEIAKDERFFDLSIPSRSRIAAYLKEQNKVRKYERHQDLPEPKARPTQRPHQEWEMDAQGVTTVAGLGKVSFYQHRQPCLSQHSPPQIARIPAGFAACLHPLWDARADQPGSRQRFL